MHLVTYVGCKGKLYITKDVALFVQRGVSYHWYRQNPDGTWSHKFGTGTVRNVDAAGNLIYDPFDSNRYFGNGANYSTEIGYFYVTPLNRMYTMTE